MTASTSPAPGRFRLLAPAGPELEAADASVAVEPDALVVLPRAGAPLRLDYADVDALCVADRAFLLQFAGGERVECSMLGPRFDEVARSLADALSAYQVKNLLLEEPVGGEPFECVVARDGREQPGRIRVYATSIAVVPREATPWSLPLGEVGGVSFAEDRYAIELATASGGVSLQQLGRQSRPCLRLVEARLGELRARTAAALASLVPQLSSLAARRLGQLLPDGLPARRAQLDEISPAIWPALAKASLPTQALRAAFETLEGLAAPGEAAFGVKETNARMDATEQAGGEEMAGGEGEAGLDEVQAATPESAEDGPMAGRVAWFAFPVVNEDRSRPGNAVAYEAATRTGRATYLFRVAPPDVYRDAPFDELLRLSRERVRSVSRAMVLLSFRRDPIWLPAERLAEGGYARYRLSLRRSEPLQASRAAFVGRALHGASWRAQLDAALGAARGGARKG